MTEFLLSLRSIGNIAMAAIIFTSLYSIWSQRALIGERGDLRGTVLKYSVLILTGGSLFGERLYMVSGTLLGSAGIPRSGGLWNSLVFLAVLTQLIFLYGSYKFIQEFANGNAEQGGDVHPDDRAPNKKSGQRYPADEPDGARQ